MVTVSCPIERLEIRGANAIQNIGGMQTYLRRYLYMAMFDITENDVFDANQGKTEGLKAKNEMAKANDISCFKCCECNKYKNKPQKLESELKPRISPEEKDELRALIGDKETEAKLLKQYRVKYLLELSKDQAKEIRERIKRFKAKTEEIKKQEETIKQDKIAESTVEQKLEQNQTAKIEQKEEIKEEAQNA
ncbi:MAG: ERF family protein [Oscillospiraceae bacterium]|jgi:hypothetical protein|nr:ERF family protein [Oscillospiraceae bacterium]